jgi:inorganic pyrophosphatase
MSSDYLRWRPHPWHGLSVGPEPPMRVSAFIEITPFDVVKYEVHKPTGYTIVDRPQATSSSPPTLYGFIPRTYCASRVQKLSPASLRGDGDPLDICIVSERLIDRAEIIVPARVVGGLQMVDGGEADDKIVAVLESDDVLGDLTDISQLPGPLIARLEHYFLTYKTLPGKPSTVSIDSRYCAEDAFQVVTAAMEDYAESYGTLED